MSEEKRTYQYGLSRLQTNFPSIKANSSKDIAAFMRQFYSDDISIFESCFILTLDSTMHTTGFMKISQGGVTGTVVDIRLIAKYAVENLASSVAIAHNHPSGKLYPSNADIAITKKLKEGLKILDIILCDHIILAEVGYYSFADEGKL